ncbi:MAG: peptidoglycan-binding domain-containing protein, partial [Actinomycetota bacterium]
VSAPRRLAAAALVLSMIAAACDAAAPATTTTSSTTSTPVATTLGDRLTLQPNGIAFIVQGQHGPYVEALQFYLICTGHGEPVPGLGTVGVDGSFGPITADAVAYYQAELRRVPSGDPDEATFASLARDCSDDRTLTFPTGEVTTSIAGNAAAGDDEVFAFESGDGQVLALTVVDGMVTIAVLDAAGTEVDPTAAEDQFQYELPAAATYSVRVSASVPTSFQIDAQVRSPNVVASEFGPMVLKSDGLGVATFGDDPVNTVAVISLLLGTATVDTGWQEGISGCTGKNRHLTWLIQGDPNGSDHPAVLIVDLTDTGGTPYFSQYAYRSYDLPALDPIAQGLATADGVSIGSTLQEFSDAYGDPTFIDAVRGLARFDDEMLVGIDVVGGDNPDAAASRIWYIGAGSDGCADFSQ